MRLARLLTLALVLPATAAARTWHVDGSGGGDAPTIQAAIDSAAAGDSVVVACGTYTEQGHGEEDGVPNCLSLHRGITLLGESDDPGCTVIDAMGNGRAFYYVGGPRPLVIARLTFRNGNATRAMGGGGIAYVGSGGLHITSCVFRANKADFAGGGLLIYGAARIQGCTFEDNTSGGSGGGVAFALVGPSSVLERCRFVRNISTLNDDRGGGGALELSVGYAVAIADCAFEDNGATNGAAVNVNGQPFGTTTFANCSFLRNMASFRAGALFADHTALSLNACRFEENAGPSNGGAIAAIFRSELDVTDCAFVRNTGSLGAAVYAADSSTTLTLTHTVFDGNVGDNGGALAAIAFASCTLSNCTMAGNAASLNGGGVYGHYGARVHMDHTILAFSTGSEAAFCTDGTSTVLASCCDVFANTGGDWTSALAGQLGGSGNLQMNPLFCDRLAGRLELQSNSPCAPANSGACGLIGALPVNCVAQAVEPSNWSRIKAMYR